MISRCGTSTNLCLISLRISLLCIWPYFVAVVPESPSIVTSPQANLIAPATVALTLDCGVKGHPSPDVRWYHDGGYIVNSSRIFTLENGTLHIENLREDDQGIYFCEAENEIGQTRSHNINVTVAGNGLNDFIPLFHWGSPWRSG